MIEPENIAELLYDYAAGNLTGDETRLVEGELEARPELREELVRYEKLLVLLTAAAQEELSAPKSLRKKVERRVAMKAYLGAVTNAAEGILGAYGRAIVYYLGLT